MWFFTASMSPPSLIMEDFCLVRFDRALITASGLYKPVCLQLTIFLHSVTTLNSSPEESTVDKQEYFECDNVTDRSVRSFHMSPPTISYNST